MIFVVPVKVLTPSIVWSVVVFTKVVTNADTNAVSDWDEYISDCIVNDNLCDYDIYNNIRIKVKGNSISSSLLSTTVTDYINNDTDRRNYLANIILDCIPTRLKMKGININLE